MSVNLFDECRLRGDKYQNVVQLRNSNINSNKRMSDKSCQKWFKKPQRDFTFAKHFFFESLKIQD